MEANSKLAALDSNNTNIPSLLCICWALAREYSSCHTFVHPTRKGVLNHFDILGSTELVVIPISLIDLYKDEIFKWIDGRYSNN